MADETVESVGEAGESPAVGAPTEVTEAGEEVAAPDTAPEESEEDEEEAE